MTSTFDLLSRDFLKDPYPTFAAMRRDAPIYVDRLPPTGTVWNEGRIWYFVRYDDCVEVLRDTKRFVKDYRRALTAVELAALPPQPELIRLANESLINLEAPEHTRLRRLASKAFSPAMVEELRPRIAGITARLLDAVEEQGEMDFMAAFAFPLPITVITEMLGLPPEDGPQLRDWAPLAPPRNPEELERVSQGTAALAAYFRSYIDLRRREPRNDLISLLATAEIDGDRLNEDSLIAMLFLLLTAGFETTVNLLGNSVLELLRHPAELERLRRDPSLVETAVEELLRFVPPILTATLRWAADDVEIGGVLIRRGDQVRPILAAANRDPARFPDPDRLDLTRKDNRHIAFGLGDHYCFGAPLARLETQVALDAILARLPDLRLAVPEDSLTYRDLPPFRGLESLPLAWGERR